MNLEQIGFYTLEDARAAAVSQTSDLWRCELILTDTCNFKCPYCRGIEEENCGHMSWADASFIVDAWASHGLHNVRFSGGEPTLWKGGNGKGLVDLVAHAKSVGIQRIAISTNGSVNFAYYQRLVDAGVNDFSISLDACCAETGDHMAGGVKGAWERVVSNIRKLSELTYVTVGVVFTEENVDEFHELVRYASDELKVSDIRILSSAQWNAGFKTVIVDSKYLERHPILKYRMNNYNNGKHVRGLNEGDNHQCPLMLDDMAILNGFHYPCIIYLRELGNPVGKVDTTLSPIEAITKIRQERADWVARTDTHKDPICAKNCLDVCRDYSNTVAELNPSAVQSHSVQKIIPIVAKI